MHLFNLVTSTRLKLSLGGPQVRFGFEKISLAHNISRDKVTD